jgi:signal transduction histidine kinase/FixJ family two-component response regulator
LAPIGRRQIGSDEQPRSAGEPTVEKGTWPAGGGKMGELVRTRDWAATSLGPIASWSSSLRTLVELVLMNPVPSALLWGEDGILIYNDGYAAICGGRHPHVFGGPLRDAWPEAWDFNGAMLAQGRAGQPQVYQNAHFMLERDGVPRDAWFDLHYAPVCGSGTAYEGVLATVLEITGRMQAEQVREAQARALRDLNAELDSQRSRLQLANQRLAGDMQFIRNLFQSSPSFMAVLLGPDHRFELTNAAYDELIHQRAVHGKPIHEALPEVVEQGFVALLDRVYRDGEPFHGENIKVVLTRRDGSGREQRILDFMYQPLKNEAGQTFGILVEGVDVTARALAEERLRVAQEAGGIGTFEWYPLRGELVVSDTYRRLWGIAPEVAVDDALLISLLDSDYYELSGVHRLGQVANPLEYVEYPIRRADTGERRWIARTGQPFTVASGEEPRYLGVAFDITDRKKAETRLRELNESLERRVSSEVAERIKAEGALRHAQKMEAVGQLASGVAHDFNNVLQIVSSNLQLIGRDTALPARQVERLEQALAAVARGSRLSLQLLAFGRKQALQPVVTHLGVLLEDMRPLLHRALGDGVDLVIAAVPALWRVAVDRNQFENAVLNMAINARDAMGGKGRLSIRAANVAATGDAGHVVLELADSGCGMTPDVLAKVFDPFYTTKEAGKGTGLGMSMVYGFVRQSGGTIRIDSTPGLGTTITIELPRVDGDHERERAAADPALHLPRGQETILLVDDDPAVRMVTVDLLEGLGYRVLTAASGDQALDILDSRVEADLLFTDVSMPGHVTSTDLVLAAARLAPGMAVLLTSGHAVEPSLLDARMPAGVALLPKPYALAQLAQALRQRLDGLRPPDSAAAPAPDAVALRFLVVEDDTESRELACEMLQALGYDAQGVGSAEQALEHLAAGAVDVLFTDLNLPGLAGDALAAQALALNPSLRVILASGEGLVDLALSPAAVTQLPKPYDLMQLQQAVAALGQPQAEPAHSA